MRSYNPRTSFGEHQFFIFIPAQDASIVHIPIVPTRLGDMEVTIHASTLIGKDSVTRKLHVEVNIFNTFLLKFRNKKFHIGKIWLHGIVIHITTNIKK